MMRSRAPIPSLRRGVGLVEVAIAVGIATLIIFGICQVSVNEIRVEKAISIAKATNEVVEVESHRLRSLPLSGFYKGPDMVDLRDKLVYYRLLPLPLGPKGEGTGRLFAEVTVELAKVKDIDAAGAPVTNLQGVPVEVTITVAPVYHKGQPVWAMSATNGVAIVDKSEFITTAGTSNGALDLRGMTQKLSFVVL